MNYVAGFSKKFLLYSVAVLAGGVLCTDVVEASPVRVQFSPPNIETVKICKPKRADDRIIAEWSDWNKKRLPKRQSVEAISRDLIRLRDIDAAKYFDVVKAGLELLKKQNSSFSETRYLLDKIKLYMKAGRFEELRNEQLITQLEALGTSSSPRAMDFLADLHFSGMVENGSEDLGYDLKIGAAYGGNANALLFLAQKSNDGEAIKDWDVAPDVAVTLAFGSLLGKLNPTICDRIGRIAREYAGGEIIAQDYALSEKWYRFAADLGDGYAAWKAAEYHLTAEFIDKDNDLLLKYLKQASDSGVVSAQLEYAKILENGALLDADPEKALMLYDQIASTNSRIGLLRGVLLAEKLGRTSGSDAKAYRDKLLRLSKTEDAPGWVFSKLARIELEAEGRWDGGNRAISYYRQAVARGDSEGKIELAKLLVRSGASHEQYYKALDLFYSSISEDGNIDAITELRRAHLCMAPSGPEVSTELYWRGANVAAGNISLALEADQVSQIAKEASPAIIADMQSQALYGRVKAMGNYIELLKSKLDFSTSEDEAGDLKASLDFWQNYIKSQESGQASAAYAQYVASRSNADKQEGLQLLSGMAEAGDPTAALYLAEIYLSDFGDQPSMLEKAEALMIGVEGVARGKLLRKISNQKLELGRSALRLTDDYLNIVKQTGDASALLFAGRAGSTRASRDAFYNMAKSVMRCDLFTVFEMAQFSHDHGKMDDLDHWLKVAEHLLEGKAWQMVKLADLYVARDTEASRQIAFSYYQKAYGLGSPLAASRLLDRVEDPKNAAYDVALAVNLFDGLIRNSDSEALFGVVSRIKRAPEAIRTAVLERHNIEGIYRKAAEVENPTAMRELAKLLRQDGADLEQIIEASLWLKRAADGRDVEAMVLLAQSYAFGIGVKPSQEMAMKWLQQAAEAGNSKASSLLSMSIYGQETK